MSNEFLRLRVAVPRLCRRHYYVDVSIRGLKAPGYLNSRLSDVFVQRSSLNGVNFCQISLLTAHGSLLIAHRSKAVNIHKQGGRLR